MTPFWLSMNLFNSDDTQSPDVFSANQWIPCHGYVMAAWPSIPRLDTAYALVGRMARDTFFQRNGIIMEHLLIVNDLQTLIPLACERWGRWMQKFTKKKERSYIGTRISTHIDTQQVWMTILSHYANSSLWQCVWVGFVPRACNFLNVNIIFISQRSAVRFVSMPENPLLWYDAK